MPIKQAEQGTSERIPVDQIIAAAGWKVEKAENNLMIIQIAARALHNMGDGMCESAPGDEDVKKLLELAFGGTFTGGWGIRHWEAGTRLDSVMKEFDDQTLRLKIPLDRLMEMRSEFRLKVMTELLRLQNNRSGMSTSCIKACRTRSITRIRESLS